MAKRAGSAAATDSPALTYLGLIRKRIIAIRKDVPLLIEIPVATA
jgi:hypothetical protein